jgi:sporulation integral membrane protein YlbJ
MGQNVIGSSRWISALFGLGAIALVGMIIAFPSQAFSASLSGLQIWWEFVFPALLPFFILSEIMLGLGIVHAVGLMLEPAMRILFRLPGAGGWAVAMGFTVGFPAGAKAASDLRKQGAITRMEGERLLAVSHLCSPVFLTSVVAVGFWGRAELGLPLIIIHYLSALLAALVLCRLFPSSAERMESTAPSKTAETAETRNEPEPPMRRRRRPPLLLRMYDQMIKAQRLDGRALGRLLGDAVGSSVQSLLAIGGFMIVFSVLIKLLGVSGVAGWLQIALETLLRPFGMPAPLSQGFVTGLFEVHLGTYGISQSGGIGAWAAALLSAAIAWSGLSVHAQVKSLIAGTDLRYTPFLVSRALHSALSFVAALALWQPLRRMFFPDSQTLEAFSPLTGSAAAGDGNLFPAWPQWGESLTLLAWFLLGAAAVSLFIRVFFPKRLLYFDRH